MVFLKGEAKQRPFEWGDDCDDDYEMGPQWCFRPEAAAAQFFELLQAGDVEINRAEGVIQSVDVTLDTIAEFQTREKIHAPTRIRNPRRVLVQ